MTVVDFDVQELAPADRAEAIRDTVGPSVLWVEVDHHEDPDAIAARGTIRRTGRLTLFSARTTPLTIRRTPRQARDDSEPMLVVALQRSGSATVVQGERQAILRPGELLAVDTSRPFTAVNAEGTHHHFFSVPRAHLALPERVIGLATAIRFGPDNPVADLAAACLTRLAAAPAQLENPGADMVERPVVELVRAVITTHLGADDLARAPLAHTLTVRIMEYARRHLHDRDLGAPRIAREFGISVRHLYAILARSGIELGDWIRTRRLEACRGDLANPRNESVPIVSIAAGRGFGDAGHFGRVFKAAYGMSPQEWRRLRLSGPPDRAVNPRS
ncbi:helix-turn-helix domain-containing protein [Streptomyces sp. NPDC047081]|uniref:helix-turn-helix domain-containing protein n=1 Tax=Streptomyces sp. NPDC047081 TaxID=3154706 RepID=UPI0033EAFB13